MVLKNSKDINLVNEDDHSIKIFDKLNFRERAEGINDSIFDSDDSNMKIFLRK